jgi:hypothetical protein
MQTRYKKVAGSVCGFPKFVTSGSGFGSGFSKIQFWVWVRVQGLKISQKTGFGVQVWVWFCKKHQNISKILLGCVRKLIKMRLKLKFDSW